MPIRILSASLLLLVLFTVASDSFEVTAATGSEDLLTERSESRTRYNQWVEDLGSFWGIHSDLESPGALFVAPNVTSISPSSPQRSVTDQIIRVNGTNFASGLTVTIFFPSGGSGTLSGTQIQNRTSTRFDLVVTLNATGSWRIRVNNPNGESSGEFTFTVAAAQTPTITSISPSTPSSSNSDQNVTVNGTNFQNGMTVTIFFPGGGSGTLSGTQLQNVTPTNFTMVATLNLSGTYGIRINNPSGIPSSTFSFTVRPSISSFSPSSPCVNDTNQSVVVNGAGFQSGLTVTVTFPTGGSTTLSGSQIQNVNATSFTMIITLGTPGSYGIRVNNPSSGPQSTTNTLNAQNCLSISSTTPSSPTQSNVDQNVQVSGSGYSSGLTVTLTFPSGGSSTLSGSQITNVTSSSFTMRATLNATGTWKLKIRNSNGNLSNELQFTVQPGVASPSVSSLNPASPTSSNVDQNVIVNGSNFQQGLTVTLTFPDGGSGVLSGTQIQNVTPTSFRMRVTLGNAGSWSMRVTNPDSGQSGPFGFQVQNNLQQPAIFSVSPSTPIARSGDQDVIVTGNNFQPNLQVPITFPAGGGVTLSGSQIQNVTPTSFIMRATLNATGSWTIRVNNPDGGGSATFPFTVTNGTNPIVNSLNPSTPITNGADQNVVVNGGNFQNGLKVNVTFPDGGIGFLQGTGQIQNVTANSFTMRITLNATGSWTMRVVNPDNSQSQQFAFTVNPQGPPPTGLPTSVLSPVIGPIRVTTSNQGISDGKWEFNQHKTGNHTATGGISLSNDTNAWDVNLYSSTSGNADAGKAVFATASGQVVSYIGTAAGSGPGAVLIAHPNAASPVWYSGYLHMVNVRVTVNQQVDTTTLLGEVGRTGANNDHLHFVVYSGQNTRGNLRSFNATVTERISNSQTPPIVESVTPANVNQSSQPQLITISGTNFQSNSIIEMRSPSDGRYFYITPETISGFNKGGGDQEIKILKATSTSITALVPFTSSGTYDVSVTNRSLNDFISSQLCGNCGVNVSPSGRTPVILIPGIMGSRIAKRESGNLRNLWLGGAAGALFASDHAELRNNVENPNSYRPLADREVVATEILRNLAIEWVTIPTTDVYDRLISYLTSGPIGFTLYRDNVPNRERIAGGCDTNQVNADLFLFPYDWRNSNKTSAKDLAEFVQCIKSIRGNPSNFSVHIIAHSMGGLVARRYILDNPGFQSHRVDRMVTLGTPWLGAPKAINTLETGGKWFDWQSLVIRPDIVRAIAPNLKGAHELIPSKAYTDDLTDQNIPFEFRYDHPLGEDGWNNFDNNSESMREYDFHHLKLAMNYRYPNSPGDTTDLFHKVTGQDDWRGDTSGVKYYNFVGYGKNTIVSLIAKRGIFFNYLDPYELPSGDGTVPLLSALRKGRQDFRGPITREKGFPLEHGKLASDGLTFAYINCVVNVPNADACINNPSSPTSSEQAVEFEDIEPGYMLKVIGSPGVIISDSFGNVSNPLSTSFSEGISTVSTNVTGDNYLSASFPLDQDYKAIIHVPSTPFSISLTKSDGQTITQAIRYVDISLPSNVSALLQISPTGVMNLAYDSDGNGTFETPVNPTISVTGTPAQDIDAPQINVVETIQGGNSQITLNATDAGTGVQRIMYSLNGTTYQQYSTPLTLNATTTPTVYAFADDNVINRSGLLTYNITPDSPGVSVSGRVLSSNGRGVRGGTVTIIDTETLVQRVTTVRNFGNYQILDVTPGRTYTIIANSRRYNFTPRTMLISDNATGVDLVADP